MRGFIDHGSTLYVTPTLGPEVYKYSWRRISSFPVLNPCRFDTYRDSPKGYPNFWKLPSAREGLQQLGALGL